MREEENEMDTNLKKWWENITYKDAKSFIQNNIQEIARSYIEIGYFLRFVRDNGHFHEDGYISIHEFAYAEFGMRKSTVNHCIRINMEFSEGGNSPIVDSKYVEFGKAQLQELLYVPEEKRDEITSDMTVAEIRAVHKPERLDIEPEQKESAEDAAVKDVPVTSEQESEEKITGEGKAPATQQGIPEQQHAAGQQKILEGAGKCVTGWSRYGACSCCGDGGVSCCNQCGESCNSRCGWIDNPYIPESGTDPDVIDAEYREEPADITVRGLLDRKRQELDTWMEAMKQDGDSVTPPGIEELKIIVQALSFLAEQQKDMAGRETVEEMWEQPPLPFLRNNKQRKEWLKKYKEWGLWYEDEHIGVKYYRYRFENGAEVIVEEYSCRSSYFEDFDVPYFHLVGGPKPPSKNGTCKWNNHEQYSKDQNSESDLVEFLKFIQNEEGKKC